MSFKETWGLRTYAWRHIPLIALVRPTVVEAGLDACVVRLPLGWLSRNHLGSMYFGALCIGADLAGGLIAMNLIRARRLPVTFLFKDFRADFRKRAEGAVVFTCRDGRAMAGLLDEAVASGERVEGPVRVVATVPDKLGHEPVAEFTLTISLKRRP